MRWVRRVTGDQFGPTRLIPLLLFASYLLLGEIFGESGVWRLFALAGLVLLVRGGVWPLAVVLGQAALIVVASLVPGRPDTAVGALATLAALAMLELAIRRPLRQTAVGALALSAALFLAFLVMPQDPYIGDKGVAPLGVILFGDILNGGVAIPLLLGACIRMGARVARVRAEERGATAVREARQAERIEIARELHDLVAHHVASMALRVGIARAVVPDLDPRVRAVLDDVHNSARTTLADLRRLLGVLRDPSTDGNASRLIHVDPADLPAAVTEVIDRGAQAGLKIESRVDPAIATLDSVRGLAVLRAVQEALTNVAKHAAGARAAVLVELLDGSVRVEVTDDGGVPDRPQPLPVTESGYGLIGLRERVELIGGTLTDGPRGDGPRRGWRLTVTLPVVAEEDR